MTQPEVEKVIRGLAACMPQTEEEATISCAGCPYNGHPCGGDYQDNDHVNLPIAMIEDIRSLLKAQEPVEPVFDAGDGKTIGQFLCGKCHAKIGFGHPHFCWYCGRAVKWE